MSKRKLPSPEVVAQLYLDGLSQAEIAARYGATGQSVSVYFKRHDLAMVRKCQQCPDTFTVNGRGGDRFCSDACRKAYRIETINPRCYSLPEPIVYAMHFPSVGKLKVGFASNRHYVAGNRAKAREVFGATDGQSIWTHAGDYRHESFVQSYLSFRYTQPDHENRRICEWFEVGDRSEAKLIRELDSVFDLIPIERAERASLAA